MDRLEELTCAFTVISALARIDEDDADVRDVEAGIDSVRAVETSQEQTRSHKGDDRQRDLTDDQAATERRAPAADAGAARFLLDRFDHVRTRGLQSRQGAEDDAGH